MVDARKLGYTATGVVDAGKLAGVLRVDSAAAHSHATPTTKKVFIGAATPAESQLVRARLQLHWFGISDAVSVSWRGHSLRA